MASNAVRLPMFPLSTVLFPRAELPLHVFEERYRAMVTDIMDADREFGTVLISGGSEVGGNDRRTDVGTLLRVEMAVPFSDGRWLLLTRGIERIRVLEWLEDDPYPQAMVERFPSSPVTETGPLLGQSAAAVRRIRMLLSELDDGPCASIDLDLGDDPDDAAWMVCALAPLGLHDAQALLETTEPRERLVMLVERCCERIADLEMLLRDTP